MKAMMLFNEHNQKYFHKKDLLKRHLHQLRLKLKLIYCNNIRHKSIITPMESL